MMDVRRTFAASAAARDASWIVVVTIEGCGTTAGELYRFCTEVPTYAVGDPLYRDWFMAWPQLAPEQADPSTGGMPSNGELEVTLLDVEDTLTDEWRVEADPTTYLTADLSSSNITVELEDVGALTAGASVIYVGNEACLVTAINLFARTVTVDRAVLDTDATDHARGVPVYVRLPYLRSRRMRLYVVNKDATSAADEREIGGYRIDFDGLTPDMNGWILRGKSVMKWFSRRVANGEPRTIEAAPILADVGPSEFRPLTISPSVSRDLSQGTLTWPGALLVARVVETGELVTIDAGLAWRIVDRGLHGTEIKPLPTVATLRLVYSADTDAAHEHTWFRWSPSSEPGRVGDWLASAQWIDILLNLALSSADVSDGLELNNRDPAYGAWDCLPIGVGIGVPYREVDLDAALAVRARTPDYLFPNFVVGDEPVPFGELVDTHFLKPIGAYFSTAGGKARVVLPSLGVSGAVVVELGADDILSKPVAKGRDEHELSASQDLTALPTEVVYTLGDGAILRCTNGLLVQPHYYAHDEKAVKLEAPSARSLGADNRSHFLMLRGMQKILRARRPPWTITPPVSYEQYARAPGDALSISHEQLPNLATGRRGWSEVYGELSRVRPHLDPDRGFWFEWEAISFGPNVRVKKIAPAARIVSWSGTEATVTSNRYTSSDAPSPLPTNDALAFSVGDLVELRSRAGVDLAPGVKETVTAVATDKLELTGDFGGALTVGTGNAGQILRYASSAVASSVQLDGFVFWADRSTRTVGATTRAPSHYGEP